jgi:glycosyltransferase involved in cell wall biosynthesis
MSTSPRDASRPALSFVVVVYDMPEQAERTLRSLSPAYQRNAAAADYEVVVVENRSPRTLGSEAAALTGPNVRYFLREEASESPVDAVNFGAAEARGEYVAIMVDGARLVTPGVVELSLMARRAAAGAALSIPGYHLGSELQQKAVDSGYDAAKEAALLASIRWPEDGYRLFEIACFSGSCAGGFFAPFAESNCLALPKTLFESLRGFDPGFRLRGGGYSNLDFYKRLLDDTDVPVFVAPGEGTFHQFHGGVTTGGHARGEREALMEALHDEYRALRGKDYTLPKRQALLLGGISPSAHEFVKRSAERLRGAR